MVFTKFSTNTQKKLWWSVDIVSISNSFRYVCPQNEQSRSNSCKEQDYLAVICYTTIPQSHDPS